jgi:FKBP-type peptidyl-prolyl cis-trans isomerase
VRFADVIVGAGAAPQDGCRVTIAFSGRLAAKNGWLFATQTPEEPFTFRLDDANVVPGLSAAVRSMRVGGVRRAVVPPSLGFQSEAMQPIPSEFWQRRRLYGTIFNPTRIANGEGDTLATTSWDLELLRVQC